MEKKNRYVVLTREQLKKVCGGRAVDKVTEATNERKSNLGYAQRIVVRAAIYRPGARGIYDNATDDNSVTWCNQATYDVMEFTGVHMRAFYGGAL